MGPYVDAHGTDRHLLTFTAPVLAEDIFLGVVGADVPVARFERHLLSAWGLTGTAGRTGEVSADVVIVNSQGRVVVSNCAHVLSGDLVPGDASPGPTACLDLTDVPWQLQLSMREPRTAVRVR